MVEKSQLNRSEETKPNPELQKEEYRFFVHLSGNSLILDRQNCWIHTSSNAKSLTADSKQPIFFRHMNT